jgi:hypothetical protein
VGRNGSHDYLKMLLRIDAPVILTRVTLRL